MSLIEQFNIGSRIKGKAAIAFPASFAPTSNGSAPTTADGVTIDRNESGLRRYYSCKTILAGAWTAAASSQAVLSVSLNFQHSSDGTSWDSFSTGTVVASVFGSSSTAGSTGTTGGTAYQTVEQSVNLNGCRRYVRCQVPAPTFADCSSGRSLAYGVTMVFGGADELPAQ